MQKLPDISKEFADWYNDIVYRAELADLSPVRGCIIVRPYGTALWENIQKHLDVKIKETGHQNALFPLFIPKSFLELEAKHVEGFAPELAVVTYAGGKELEEPLVVRPTSETIIHYMFAKWIKSWRDLPIKINQWANVVRWEKRTRPFLRTIEFWWQEGHTAHETAQEAESEAQQMLTVYKDFAEKQLAIPVIAGIKSDSERFAGADKTLTVEALMQDGKALQLATSHLISQNFARSFGMSYQDRDGKLAYPYLTSWGATTRLIGAVVMVHGDNNGLVLPPAIAPIQVVIVPITTADNHDQIMNTIHTLTQHFKKTLRIHIDQNTESTPGAKFYHWEMKGVPLRVEVGPRDIAKNQVILVSRLDKSKKVCSFDSLEDTIEKELEAIQKEMFNRAEARLKKSWFKREKFSEFVDDLENNGGLYQTGWCRSETCEQIFKQHKATTRCLVPERTYTTCCICSNASPSDVLIAKSY